MSKRLQLIELYNTYANFGDRRAEMLQEISMSKADQRTKIRQLQIEKKRKALEYDIKIQEIRDADIQEPKEVTEILNTEKQQIRDKMFELIAAEYRSGSSAIEIANYLGLNSTTMIYQAIAQFRDVEQLKAEVAVSQAKDWEDIKWTYFDNAAIHRYAISSCGKFMLIHDPHTENHRIVTNDTEFTHLAGNHNIRVQPQRAAVAQEMFNGTYDGDYIESANPYK